MDHQFAFVKEVEPSQTLSIHFIQSVLFILITVKVWELAGNKSKVGPIEAIDGTPVADIKLCSHNQRIFDVDKHKSQPPMHANKRE